MAEDLTAEDVEAYTGGRLLASDPKTQILLDGALAKARAFCGWHVTPVIPDAASIRERPYEYFVLPTLKLVSIESITQNGENVDPADVKTYKSEPGVVYRGPEKLHHRWGCNPLWHGEIEVAFTHGFTAAEAADFRSEVLALVDRTAEAIGTGGSGPLVEKKVDDVTYRWLNVVDEQLAGAIAKDPLSFSALYRYRILAFA